MRWFGPRARLEIIEQDDGLLIQSTGLKRGIDLVVSGCVVVVCGYIFWRDENWFSAICFVCVAVLGTINLFRDQNGELWVTEEDLEASGYLGGMSNGHVRLRWSGISGLTYRAGGEDEPCGLYAGSTCVLANLNEEQANEIIAAIYRRFPYLEMAEDSGGWSLFGGRSGLTTLGLSKSDE